MNFVELFCGIGGFRLGLEPSGWRCLWANDNYKYACQVYRKNFGDKELVEGDIREIPADSIPDHDLLTAGFPCQAFSIAGRRSGFQDTRGTLFFEIARVIQAKRPSLVLLENVGGLLSAQKGYCFWRIIQTLDELGYDVEWQMLNSKHYGVPQNRQRVFVVGHLRGRGGRQVFPLGKSNQVDVREKKQEINLFHNSGAEIQRIYNADGVAPCLHKKTGGWQEPKIAVFPCLTPNRPKRQAGRRFKNDGEPMFTLTGRDVHGIGIKKLSPSHFQKTVYDPRGLSPTLREGHSDVVRIGIDNFQVRRLTPVECERLQGFPDGWTEGVSDRQRYILLGNAVTVNVIRFLGALMFLARYQSL